MPPDFVLDLGVPLAWIVTSQATRYSADVLSVMPRSKAVVPPSWPMELTSAVWLAERRGTLTVAYVTSRLAQMANFRIDVDDHPYRQIWIPVLDLARRYSITVHNAAYIELAQRLNIPLATITPSLTRAAIAAGVPVFAP